MQLNGCLLCVEELRVRNFLQVGRERTLNGRAILQGNERNKHNFDHRDIFGRSHHTGQQSLQISCNPSHDTTNII